jgi:hypothetical protein
MILLHEIQITNFKSGKINFYFYFFRPPLYMLWGENPRTN